MKRFKKRWKKIDVNIMVSIREVSLKVSIPFMREVLRGLIWIIMFLNLMDINICEFHLALMNYWAEYFTSNLTDEGFAGLYLVYSHYGKI